MSITDCPEKCPDCKASCKYDKRPDIPHTIHTCWNRHTWMGRTV